MSLPMGFAVLLGAGGRKYISDIADVASNIGLPQEEKEFQDIINQISEEVKVAIDNQKRIEQAIGEIDLQAAYDAYAIGKPMSLEQITKEARKKIENSETTIEKQFNAIIDAKKKQIEDAAKTIGELRAQGQDFSPEAAVAFLKSKGKVVEDALSDLSSLEKEIISLRECNDAEYQKIASNLNELIQSFEEGDSYDIFIENGKITVSSQKTKKTMKELQKYLQLIYDRKKGNIRGIRNAKYNSTSGKRGAVKKALEDARKAIESTFSFVTIGKEDIAKKTLAKIFNKLADAIESENKKITVTTPLSTNYDSKKMGELIEAYHSITMPIPTQSRLANTAINSIQITPVGNLQTRKQYIKMKCDEKINISIDDYYVTKKMKEDWEGEQEQEVEDLKVSKDVNAKGKIDSLLTLSKENGQKYYIAFSDKFYSGYNLSKIGLIGNTFNLKKDEEIKPASLLNNIDLFTAIDSELAGQLTFMLLNSASASMLSGNYTTQIEELVEKMVSSYILQIAFNLKGFIENYKKLPDGMDESNTLLIFNFTDVLFVKGSEVLQRVLDQLKAVSGQDFKKLVTVTVVRDTIHQAVPLYAASLEKFHPNGNDDPLKEQRWEWVAQQIAANTLLGVKLNVQSLLQIYDNFPIS